MQIPALKVQGKSAMVMIMHATEIPEGNFWMKVVAQEALKTLSAYDYAGLLYWNGQESWLFTVQPIGENKGRMLAAIDRMQPSDMLDFGPSVQQAINGLRSAKDAMTKHIVVISDGDPARPTSAILQQCVANKITVTTVLTAAHGNDAMSRGTMKDMATATKGRFYEVTNPKALPRIYQKEARLISKPLIFEKEGTTWPITVDHVSEPVAGLTGSLPPISGIVLTSVKENELVEVPLRSPLPTGQMNPLLAHWTYGLGRSVAFTSDAGRRWTARWPEWEGYAAFWSQVVRWSLRPVDKGNLSLTLRREEGRIKVVVDALDKDNQFLNFLNIRGNVVNPDLKRAAIELAQAAPGRYEGVIEDAESRGNYFVNLGYTSPDGASGLVTSGVSVPYSDEYRDLQSNPAALRSIADVTNGQSFAWKTGRDGAIDAKLTAESTDVFRRDPTAKPPSNFQDLWPSLLWLAAMLFLGDVAVRRVAPDLDRLKKKVADALEGVAGPGSRPAARLHGEAEGPQGRGRRTARPLPRRRPLRGPPAARRPDRRTPPGRRLSGPAAAPRPGPRIAYDRPERPEAPRARELHESAAQGQAEGVGRSREGEGQAVSHPRFSRLSLATLMALVGALALELAAMRAATPSSAIASFNLTLFLLLVGMVGALVRRGEAGWTGFAVFGWCFAVFSFIPAFDQLTPGLPTTPWLNDLATSLHPVEGSRPGPPMLNPRFLEEVGDLSNLASFRPGMRGRDNLSPSEEIALDAYLDRNDDYQAAAEAAARRRVHSTQVGRSLSILAFAIVGAVVGKLIAPAALQPIT